MGGQFLVLVALILFATGTAGCAGVNQGAQASDNAASSDVAGEDRLLNVRSNYWSPLVIDLVGDGVRRRIGTVERLQPRTFRIPAHLVASGAFVSLDAREAGASSGYSTGLFSLARGEAVDLLLEHTLTLSTFEIKNRR
jgi:hypothetical protein